jgi:hypothetical protein
MGEGVVPKQRRSPNSVKARFPTRLGPIRSGVGTGDADWPASVFEESEEIRLWYPNCSTPDMHRNPARNQDSPICRTLPVIALSALSFLVGCSEAPPGPVASEGASLLTGSYLGCYTDAMTRALPDELMSSGATVESCVAAASARGLKYAGLQYGGQCFAGNTLGYALAVGSECNMRCTADAAEVCGGTWRNSIYATSTSPPPPTGPEPPPQAAGYKLKLDTDFTTMSSFDLAGPGAVWYHSTPCPAPADQIELSDGVLNLNWSVAQPSNWCEGTSISTAGPGNGSDITAWQHFYVEIKMSFEDVTGAWPALWMQPSEFVTGNGEIGEIDIFEAQGNNVFQGHLHDWTGPTTQRAVGQSVPTDANLNEPHIYGLLWVPGKVTWYFDNRALFSFPSFPIMEKQQYYLIVSNTEGENWTYGEGASSVKSLWMKVDWVHVFQPE